MRRGCWEGRDIELRRTLGLCSTSDVGQEENDRALLLAALRDQQLPVGDLLAVKELDTTTTTELMVAIEQILSRSPSAVMIANLSDMLAEVVQINVPGTISEHPNWRYRFRLPVSALSMSPSVRQIALAVAAERRKHPVSPQCATVRRQ